MGLNLRTGSPRTTYDEASGVAGFWTCKTLYTGIGTTYGDTITMADDEVALVDPIVFTCPTTATAANRVITLKINDVEMPFNIPGTYVSKTQGLETVTFAVRNTVRYVWKTAGNLVVNPSKKLQLKCDTAKVAHARIRLRWMKLTGAYQNKLLPATLPTVATHGNLVAATAKVLVTSVDEKAVEILGFCHTGHGFSATAGTHRLGFWEGGIGTNFATGGKTVFMALARGIPGAYAPTVFVGNTHGCIQGPVGWGVYSQASATLAGTPANGCYNILYRLVPAKIADKKYTSSATYNGPAVTSLVMNETIDESVPQSGQLKAQQHDGTWININYSSYVAATGTFTIRSTALNGGGGNDAIDSGATVMVFVSDVNDPRGAAGQKLYRPKWWACNEDFSGFPTGDGLAIFDSSITNVDLRIRGHAGSVECGEWTEPATVAPAQFGIGYGTNIITGATWSELFTVNSNGEAGTNTNTFYDDQMVLVGPTSVAPSFMGSDESSKITDYGHLVWGTANYHNPKDNTSLKAI